MAEHLFDELKRYVSFGADDEDVLRELGPLLEPELDAIVEAFYARIEQHAGALAVIAGGASQVQRLKATLRLWLQRCFAGPWDLNYFEQRAQIGRRHVLIQLPQHYNLTAMNVIRSRLTRSVLALGAELERTQRRLLAIGKLLDLELAVILHTYNEDFSAQLLRSERLATFGQMTSAIAHELRNPLGVIESSAFLLRQRARGDPAVIRHADKIQAQVVRSNRIITSLLDIVRERPPLRSWVAPALLAERAASALHDATGFGVQLHTQADLPQVSVDPAQIQQVLLNLLNNALEATGSGGVVRLTLRARDQSVEFLIADDGPGIDPRLGSRIFEPLMTTKEGGVGLGLSLCRKLVQAHQGVLEVVSSLDLQGAAFSLRLPVSADVPEGS